MTGDAAFASPDIYFCIDENSVINAIRIKTNNNIYREIDHVMTRPVGRSLQKQKAFFHAFSYLAASWKKPRTVIAEVEWHIDEVLPTVGFVVRNMNSSPEAVVHFYIRRGKCEQNINEGKHALTRRE